MFVGLWGNTEGCVIFVSVSVEIQKVTQEKYVKQLAAIVTPSGPEIVVYYSFFE